MWELIRCRDVNGQMVVSGVVDKADSAVKHVKHVVASFVLCENLLFAKVRPPHERLTHRKVQIVV